ncbi:MAG: hypothetical protein D6805_06400 [Planctomycetota bacterium]|nr:MAG: hypothetical protein D6805_06400 [Planctomycetota bacterium]
MKYLGGEKMEVKVAFSKECAISGAMGLGFVGCEFRLRGRKGRGLWRRFRGIGALSIIESIFQNGERGGGDKLF